MRAQCLSISGDAAPTGFETSAHLVDHDATPRSIHSARSHAYSARARCVLTAPMTSTTVRATSDAVRPKCSYTAGAGADSPKVVVPITAPSLPTYLRQRSGCEASTATI